MKNLRRDFEIANELHDFFCIDSNCFNDHDQKDLVSADYIVCVDDDPISAIYATELYFMAIKQNKPMQIVCVGGIGLLSQFFGINSEADRLADFCRRLGVPKNEIHILNHGHNTGENIKEIVEFAYNHKAKNLLFAVTKRLSLRFERSFKKQMPTFLKEFSENDADLINDYYYVIEQSVEEAANWLNGKRASGGRTILHEIASIYPRCLEYSGTFQEPLSFSVPQYIIDDANYLARRYRLKIGKRGPRELLQMLRIYLSLEHHTTDMKIEESNIIMRKRTELSQKYLLDDGTTIDFHSFNSIHVKKVKF